MHKEDHQFFSMVRQEFSETELEAIAELFRREDEKYGGNAFEENRRLVQEMAGLLT
jgi:hemerythrin-like domain-containing protein